MGHAMSTGEARKTCLITGANAGIGMEAAVQIAEAGLHVVMVCRSRERGEAALREVRERSRSDAVELLVADMSLQASIRRMAAAFLAGHQTLDVLIHNAAAFDYAQKLRSKTEESIETIWATNHLGPVLLTNLLLDVLKRSDQGRVITVSSKGLTLFPSLEVNLKWTVTRAYYQSKLAQVVYTYWLAEQLARTAVTVNCVRVTNVRLDVRRYPSLSLLARLAYSIKSRFALSPGRMALTYTYLATSDEVRGISGKCFDEHNRQVRTNRRTYDREHVQRVMDLTARYLADGPRASE
jgi:NAD(P)-dependent dehydrogenase (short-subunit alcohol dehydrogenase family)